MIIDTVSIARGDTQLSPRDIFELAKRIDFRHIRPEFLPKEALANNSLTARKMAIALLAEKLWPFTTSDWLQFENDHLKAVRARNGNSKDDGKDDLSHVVSQEILIRVYAVAYLYYQNLDLEDIGEIASVLRAALLSLNTFLTTVCLKGYTRAQQVNVTGKAISTYSFLTDNGIPVAGSGHYLPDPEKTLPYLIGLLRRESMRPEIYTD